MEARTLRRITPEWIHQKSLIAAQGNREEWKIVNPDPFPTKSPTRIYIYCKSPIHFKANFIYWGQPAHWMQKVISNILRDRHPITKILLAEWDRQHCVMLFQRNYRAGRDGPTFHNITLWDFYHPQYAKNPLSFDLILGDLAQYKWKRFEDKYRFSPRLSVQKWDKEVKEKPKEPQWFDPEIMRQLHEPMIPVVRNRDVEEVRRRDEGEV